LNQCENNGVIIRGLLDLVLCGPKFDELKEEVEERKRTRGGFHPHVANRILSQFLPEIAKEKNWDTTTITSAQRRYGLYT
jgi:hypothetical protein